MLSAMLGADPPAPAVPLGGASAVSAAVAKIVDFYGPTDLVSLAAESPAGAGAAQQLLGVTPQQDPTAFLQASPLSYVTPASAPMLFIQGTRDPVVPFEQSEHLAETLTSQHVPNHLLAVFGAGHGFEFQKAGRD